MQNEHIQGFLKLSHLHLTVKPVKNLNSEEQLSEQINQLPKETGE